MGDKIDHRAVGMRTSGGASEKPAKCGPGLEGAALLLAQLAELASQLIVAPLHLAEHRGHLRQPLSGIKHQRDGLAEILIARLVRA